MFAAAENLEFETAARLRDELKRLEAAAGKAGATPVEIASYEPYGTKRKKAPASGKRSSSGTGSATSKRGARRYR